MAKYNEILVGRYNRFLQKLLSIKGEPPAPQLASEITPQFNVEDIPLELRQLLGWTSWGTFIFVAASVGNLSAVRIRNPVTSNAIIILEKIHVDVGAANNNVIVNRQITNSDLGATFSGALRDARASQPVARGSVALISQSNPAATSGASLHGVNLLANTGADIILTENQEVVIAPGDSVTVFVTNVNDNLQVSFFWRERSMEEGET